MDETGPPAAARLRPEALRFWTFCLDLSPDGIKPEWLNGRAQALFRLGRTAEARAAWESLIERFPEL